MPTALGRESLHRLEQRTQHASGTQEQQEVRKALRQCMWDGVGVRRQAKTLEAALDTILTLADQARACHGDRPATIVRCLELDNLIITAEAIARAALFRQESRGTHYREDCPERDDATWRWNVLVRQAADGTLQVHKAPIVTV